MTTPSMHGPLRVETVDGHPWVLGEGIACACGDMAEAEALLNDLRLRLGNPLLDAVRQAFGTVASRGWITQVERDLTGAVCRAFDTNPDAPGFAAVCHPVADDHAVIECGEGIGDEDADMAAAEVVATALRNAGLTTSISFRDGAAYVAVRRPGTGPHEALAKRLAACIREDRGLKPTEVVRVTVHGEDGTVVWEGDVK